MDELHTALYRQLFQGDGDIDIETAVDIALVGRYYERFADHAVMVGRRIAFATGARGAVQPRS